jgi:hypothetical protein
MRIGDLRSAHAPHHGQEGKDIVVLDRWARTAPRALFHRSRDRTRVGTMKVAARVPL